jgi:hypothetical protein
MTLTVPFDQFAETAARMLGHRDVFLQPTRGGTSLSAANPERNALIVSRTPMSPEDARTALERQGAQVYEGRWSLDEEGPVEGDDLSGAYAVAISYLSGDDKPGAWLDVYPSLPTHMQAIKALYDEFRQTGELGEVSVEEFVRLAKPNVVIASPKELQSFLKQKEEEVGL